MTSYWSKADKYNWTETTTTTWSVSGGPSADALSKIKTVLNLSVSKSKAYAVGISIPANPAKESKLGLFGDFNRYYVKMSDALERDVSYHNVSEPTDVQYLIVVYK
ncbi:hypothetical protein [Paenibacillus silvae]|uniref:hypothetical protein n=1 Tax=Paenibacillus silvae TaxID=1325358 RepID=UPI0011B84C8D|nr:hypothetical protein [Paenibacillus silvae]